MTRAYLLDPGSRCQIRLTASSHRRTGTHLGELAPGSHGASFEPITRTLRRAVRGPQLRPRTRAPRRCPFRLLASVSVADRETLAMDDRCRSYVKQGIGVGALAAI